MRAALPALAALLLAGALLPAQDAVERAGRALDAGDRSLARTALLESFDRDAPEREQRIARGLAVFRERGASDLWLDAAERWVKGYPDDALLLYYVGVTWQDLQHLRRAESALARALAAAPDNPAVRQAYAWNAARRFDAETALERAKAGGFPDAEALRREQRARLEARPSLAIGGFLLLGITLVGATILVLRRLS